jgi:pimeloyl-ACP methyl ester carboxylesterase
VIKTHYLRSRSSRIDGASGAWPRLLSATMRAQRSSNARSYADYFATMFASPRQRYIDAGVLSDDELGRIRARVVMLHGRDDQPCPAKATTLAVARHLASADVHLLGACGHNLPRKRTADYLEAAIGLFGAAA